MSNSKLFKTICLFLIMSISIIGLIYSIVNIIIWNNDNKQIKNQITEIMEVVEVEEIEDNNNTEVIEPEEEIPEFNPYWDYIKMNLINIDFKELKEINSKTVGWLQVGGTNINYPFVQANDNKYYLTHSFNNSYNQAGWAFLDYRNNKNESDKNTIIYGHDLQSGAIFGSLKNILNESWQIDTKNHIVKLSTEYENTLWQVFSIYTTPTTSDYLKINFESNDEFYDFISMLRDRSIYNFDTTVNENDKILTLSSCYINADNKIVLHAKLIKREKNDMH